MKHERLTTLVLGILPMIIDPSKAVAQLSTFSVLGGSTVTNTGAGTVVTGNLGLSPGTVVTGFPPGTVVGGSISVAPALPPAQAQSELTTLYNQLAGATCNTNLTGQDLGGLILTPGVYCFDTSAQLTGTLTLDAQNSPNSVFLFKIGSTLTTAVASLVGLINSTSTCGGVSWQVGNSATLGTGTQFIGDIVALSSITLTTGASVNGRVLARNGAVALDNSPVSFCSARPALGIAPPTIAKAFGLVTAPLNGTTSLTFTVTNPNVGASLTGVGVTDGLPAGLVVATPNGLAGSCGGGSIAATAGSSTVSLLGATLASGASCSFSVNVTGTTLGTKNNNTGNVTSNEGGPGNTASASITILGGLVAPSITKAFGAVSTVLNGTTSLSFTVSNPNAGSSLSGVGVTDGLPAGLVVATPNGVAGSCGGGSITATAGSANVSLLGATLAPSASCTFSVNVTATTLGLKNNVTSNVTSIEAGPGNIASASITILPVAPPSITKAFGAVNTPLNGTTSLTFNVTNPNAGSSLSGVGFSDPLPAGLVVATPNGLTGSCGGGVITATAGSATVSLSGATLASSALCTFSVNVMGTSLGVKNNLTGNVTSIEAGPGNTASASITVLAPGPGASGAPAMSWPVLAMLALGLAGLGSVLARKAQRR